MNRTIPAGIALTAVATAAGVVAGSRPADAAIYPPGCHANGVSTVRSNTYCWVGPSPTYSYNSTYVTAVQTVLQGAGFQVGCVDGGYDGTTSSGIHSYQAARGLSQDGIVGPQTWDKVFGELTPIGAGGGYITYASSWDTTSARIRDNLTTDHYEARSGTCASGGSAWKQMAA